MKPRDVPVDHYRLTCADDLKNVWPWLSKLPAHMNFTEHTYYVLCYEVEANFHHRSLNQNNLYWEWLAVLAKFFSRGKKRWSKDDMHDLMRHNFLGYENKRVGKTDLKPVLRSTSVLDKSEMSEYLNKFDAWAQDHGVFLPYPADGDYAKYKEART